MEQNIFWDKDISQPMAVGILQNPSHPRFSEISALLLSRTNDIQLVFSQYLDKRIFVQEWRRIKSEMRKNKWSDERIDLWSEVHSALASKVEFSNLGKQKRINKPAEFESVGQILKDRRIKLEFTQQSLAKEAHIAQQTVSNVENGKGDISLSTLKRILDALRLEFNISPEISYEQKVFEFLDDSSNRFKAIAVERGLVFPEHGAMEVAAMVEGKVEPYATNQDFLNSVLSSNPNYTGWPTWTDSRSFSKQDSRPYAAPPFWEALIEHSGGWSDDLDFWRIGSKGQYYLYRALQDDVGGSRVEQTRLKTLDFGLVVLRVAEAIATALSFAKEMKAKDNQNLSLGFRWTKLKGRKLSSWANPGRHLSFERKSYIDQVVSYTQVPINTQNVDLYKYVHEANKPIFEIFDGFVLSEKVTEDLVTKLLERKLS